MEKSMNNEKTAVKGQNRKIMGQCPICWYLRLKKWGFHLALKKNVKADTLEDSELLDVMESMVDAKVCRRI